MEYEAISSAARVKGNAMLAIVNGIMHRDLALEILAKHGITDIDPDEWYPEQSWLDAFAEIGADLGDAALYAIGRAIPQVIDIPDDINSAIEAIERLDEVYQSHHKGLSGAYVVEITGESSARIISKNPRPCAYDMGFITAYVEMFNGGKTVSIEHEDELRCRKHRCADCSYIVNW
ncbi:hypothetical protein DRO30_05885 [Candidatus Bathyarchaeota archaeon]|nr:MAG: hypothetical protein DRO30_05885 [Candidatus Bathyarchaeota archaeon]